MLKRSDRIEGTLLGAAIGDAMGAPTESCSTRQIEAQFGGRVTTFETPPDDSLAAGRRAGQVTDAFSIPLMLTQALLAHDGPVTRRLGERVLLEWSDTPYYEPFAGMTTRNVIKRLRQDESMGTWAYAGRLGTKLYKGHYYALSSNGAAVKAYPPVFFHPEDRDAVMRDVIELTMASHDDPHSVAGACATAMAVFEAMQPGATVRDIVCAARAGAVEGGERARALPDIWLYAGPSVVKRIDLAETVALRAGTADERAHELGELIGSGPAIAETVPLALGLLIAYGGECVDALLAAVNIGDETSAIASLVGAIVGAYRGPEVFPETWRETVERENGFDAGALADAICRRVASNETR